MPAYHVYILRCSDGSYYAGHATDLTDRLRLHNEGRGAKHTVKHRPVHLVYSEPAPTEAAAMRRERQLKRWSHAKKGALIAGHREKLRDLAQSRD